ncbi:MAG: DNA cytosine methyltransferase [Labilithrix sp.]|nr:DNA cytosine methyltransferase [Labilithrix sp.]MCW5817884.1 DNA cytosine methyltransferase [Labilithrix sp.]
MTVGLKAAGFQVVAGVELEPHAFATYKTNHPEVHAYRQDIRTVDGASLLGHADDGVDLLAGCPPCQGFSSLTAKWKRSDPRNALVAEMTRLIGEVRPRVVMMENVPGLAQKGKRRLNALVRALEDLGYRVTFDVLQVADYGVPQRRRRLVLLAGLGFEIPLPSATHSRTGAEGLPKWRSLRDAIGAQHPRPITLAEAQKKGGPARFDWHVTRTMSPQNVRRMAHAKPGRVWSSIPKRLRPACHQDAVRKIGFRSAYGRLKWDEPSVTITGGCTTFSKGRFGHPTQPRTISVREAALIQTFPPSYVFDTPFIDYACEMIGNALPCTFAEVVARQCLDALESHQAASSRRTPKPTSARRPARSPSHRSRSHS